MYSYLYFIIILMPVKSIFLKLLRVQRMQAARYCKTCICSKQFSICFLVYIFTSYLDKSQIDFAMNVVWHESRTLTENWIQQTWLECKCTYVSLAWRKASGCITSMLFEVSHRTRARLVLRISCNWFGVNDIWCPPFS